MYPFFLRLSRVMAVLGGLMLTFLIVMVCVSILGRSLNGILHSDGVMAAMPGMAEWLLAFGIGPINGDFEMVETGVAFAIFAFLPLCQITGGHASVDIFTSKLSARTNRLLQMLIDLLFAFVLVVIAVQLFGGLQSKLRSGQTTLILEIPVWWGYAICMLGAVTAAVVGVYVAVTRIREVATGEAILTQMEGADH